MKTFEITVTKVIGMICFVLLFSSIQIAFIGGAYELGKKDSVCPVDTVYVVDTVYIFTRWDAKVDTLHYDPTNYRLAPIDSVEVSDE